MCTILPLLSPLPLTLIPSFIQQHIRHCLNELFLFYLCAISPEQSPSLPRTFLDVSNSSLLIPSEFRERESPFILGAYIYVFLFEFWLFRYPIYPVPYTSMFPEFNNPCVPFYFHGLPSAWLFHPTAQHTVVHAMASHQVADWLQTKILLNFIISHSKEKEKEKNQMKVSLSKEMEKKKKTAVHTNECLSQL